MKPYTIDTKTGTITYTLDADTGKQETATIAEVLDLFFWLRSRELELRQMVYNHAPIIIERPMMLDNGYYVGVTAERQKVKVTQARYLEVWQQTEQFARRQWLEAQQYKDELAHRTGGVELVYYAPGDNTGREVLSHAPTHEQWTEADAPDYLINDALAKLRTSAFWVGRGDNLDAGQWLKLP